MVKYTFIGRLLTRRVTSTVIGILAIITTIQLFSCGVYHYSVLPKLSIEKELYLVTVPNLVHHKNKPACGVTDILKKNVTLENWWVPNKVNIFTPEGIENGSYVPKDCNARISVAILVTYRNRQSQLDAFVPYMHMFLREQNIHYKIFIIEQKDDKPFNKGMLYNIGAKHAIAEKFPCLILHDVDLLPMNDANLYACLTTSARHLSANIDKMRFVLPYWWLVGGVLAVRSEHYLHVNGFSNRFEGWGGEDDDFYERLAADPLNIVRFPRAMSEYHMIPHPPEAKNAEVWNILDENKKMGRVGREHDGLRSISYSSLQVYQYRLFTLISVKL